MDFTLGVEIYFYLENMLDDAMKDEEGKKGTGYQKKEALEKWEQRMEKEGLALELRK